MVTKIKKIASLVLALILALSTLAIPKVKAQAAGFEGYEKITENSSYELFLCEEDLSIILRSKATGEILESAISYDDGKNNATWLGAMKSAVVLTTIYSNVDTDQVDLINDKNTCKIKKNKNGFSAEIYWTKYKFGLTLEVSLEGNELVAKVPDASIREDGDKYNIGTISVYPFFGHSYLDTKEGYMYIPDGNGALIYLDNKEGRFATGYTSMIYGEDIGFDESKVETLLWDKYSVVNEAEKILSPTFGMAHTKNGIGFLGIVEEGAERCSIVASPNGANVDYNRIYPRFLERKLYTQPASNNSTSGSFRLVEADRTHSDLTVRYILLEKENANYTGMANAYRNYLLNKNILKKGDVSYRTRIDFLGTDREEWVIGTTPVVMTTVEDISDIYEDLAEEGLTNILSLYKGWQKGGIYNLPVSTYKADSKIGGTKALTKLVTDAEARGTKLYLYTDSLRINPDENNATFNVAKKINKKKYTEITHKDVYEEFQFLTGARTKYLVNRLVKSYLNKGVNNVAIGGISNTLFSYSYSNVFYSRKALANDYGTLLSEIDKDTDLVLEQPFVYLWNSTEAFADMPLSDSEYIFEDEFVPFLSLVLKGVMPVYSEYINFEGNKQEYFLKMVETGSFPSFYITKNSSAELIYTNSCDIYSSEYSVYRDTILEYSKELEKLNGMVEGSYIKSHEIVAKDLRKIVYENGVTIYINYGEEAKEIDKVTVDSMSYRVIVND